MALSEAGEEVLRSIFAIGSERALAVGPGRVRVPTPSSVELYEFCEILASSPKEEVLQKFLERNPGFLTGIVGTSDNSDLAVLFKPPVNVQFKADFCVLQAFQGGAVAHLFEIESCHEALFTQKLTPAKRLAGAIGQVEDWRQWINRSQVLYAKELIRQARSLPLYGQNGANERGFRLLDPEKLERIWSGFGGFDEPFFSYTVLIGRWSKLSREEKARLVSMNRHGANHLKIFTYEQVARHANFRLERDEWSSENERWREPDAAAMEISEVDSDAHE